MVAAVTGSAIPNQITAHVIILRTFQPVFQLLDSKTADLTVSDSAGDELGRPDGFSPDQ